MFLEKLGSRALWASMAESHYYHSIPFVLPLTTHLRPWRPLRTKINLCNKKIDSKLIGQYEIGQHDFHEKSSSLVSNRVNTLSSKLSRKTNLIKLLKIWVCLIAPISNKAQGIRDAWVIFMHYQLSFVQGKRKLLSNEINYKRPKTRSLRHTKLHV